MQRETKEVALIVSTPALAGPGQPEAPPSPHLDRWHVKTTPARFPRAGPCPRCPAVQVTTPSPCPSLSTIAQRFHFLLPFLFLTLSIPSDLHSQSPTPSSHRALPCSDPKAPPPRPRTSLLRARHGGASKQQPKHTDPTSPPAAAVSSELRPAPKHHHINSPAAICAARPRPFPKPGPRRKGGPRRGNIGGAAHHHVPCPARLLLTRPRRGRRRQTRWSGTRCCRPLPNGPTSCP